jgi:hypothetical protein
MSAIDMVEVPTSTTTDVVKVLALTSMVQDFYDEANVVATDGLAKVNHKNDWIVDSGCSNHMTGDEDKFKSMRPYNGNRVVMTADNTQHPMKHIGDAKIALRYGDNGILHGVYHVPGMAKNLLSVPQITATGHYVLFGPEDVKIFQKVVVDGIPVITGKKVESIYVLSVEEAYVEKTRKNETPKLWHAQLGHAGYTKLYEMSKRGIVRGLPKLNPCSNIVCAGCQFGKAYKLPFQESNFESKAPLELVHIDVFGKVRNPSISGMRCMITFIDDFSRYVWVYFMKEKSKTLEKFKEFCTKTESLVGHRIQCLRTDNGGEYTSDEFNDYLKRQKIQRQFTCPNTPQQNGVAERENRHLGETYAAF